MSEPGHFDCQYFIIYDFRNVSCFTFFFFFKNFAPLMRGLYLSFVHFFFQVLGEKPELRDGEEDDDIIADITNRKMAKLYMVGSL